MTSIANNNNNDNDVSSSSASSEPSASPSSSPQAPETPTSTTMRSDQSGTTTTTTTEQSTKMKKQQYVNHYNDPSSGLTESRVIRLSEHRRVGKLLGLQGFTNQIATTTTEEVDASTHTNDTTSVARSEAGTTTTTIRQIDETFLYYSIASFLASKHFNERNGSILPQLPQLLDGCDFYWGYEYRDGQQQGFEATRQFIEAMDSAYYHKYDNHNLGTNHFRENHKDKTSTRAPISDGSGGTDTINQEEDERGHHNHRDNDDPRSTPNDHEIIDHDVDDSMTQYISIQQATKYLEPFAVYGAYWSQVSKVVGAVTGAFEIPYISGVSHSSQLEGMPYFARTSPNNDGDAQAAMVYYAELGITHVAILYLRDTWGIDYHASLTHYASEHNINLVSFAYDPNPQSIESALNLLKESQYRYVYGVLHDGGDVLPVAYRKGIVGNRDYVWIMAEGISRTGGSGQEVKRTDRKSDLAMALHGVGTLSVYHQDNPAFDEAMAEIATNPVLQSEFIGIQADPQLFDNYTFPEYNPTSDSRVIFDAVMALGIAACDPTHNLPDLFTGPELFAALLNTEFDGASGHVQFNPKTGSRLAKHVQFAVEYLVIDEDLSDNDYVRYDSKISAIMQDNTVRHINPFLYNDNTAASPLGTTTIAPLALPPVEGFNLNKIPEPALIFGYVCAAFVILSSVACFMWTVLNRKLFVVKASQPFFLCQLCVGIFITGFTCIPWSFALSSDIPTDDPDNEPGYREYYEHNDPDGLGTRKLDFACNASLWLIFIGHAVTFSALASKTWRINQVLQNGRALRRSKIGVKQAILPLYMSLAINISMLLCITMVSPLQYERVPLDNYDQFGRSLESYGICAPSSDKIHVFMAVLLVSNLCGLVVVTKEAHRGRNAPTLFSDAQYLAWALMAIMETVMIGGPIFFVVDQDPTAFYVAASSLLFLCCMSILVLMFAPKFIMRNYSHGMNNVVVSGLPRSQKQEATTKSDAVGVNPALDESRTSSTGSLGSSQQQQHGKMLLTRHS